VRGVPSDRLTDQGLVLGSFDLAPPTSSTGQAFNVTVQGSWNRASPASSLVSSLPASGFNTTAWSGAIQGHHTNYYGFALSETGVSVNESRRYLSPYLDLPAGAVLVNSQFADGTSGVQSIVFGGATAGTSSTTRTLDLTNQLSWFSPGNRHRVKITS